MSIVEVNRETVSSPRTPQIQPIFCDDLEGEDYELKENKIYFEGKEVTGLTGNYPSDFCCGLFRRGPVDKPLEEEHREKNQEEIGIKTKQELGQISSEISEVKKKLMELKEILSACDGPEMNGDADNLVSFKI